MDHEQRAIVISVSEQVVVKAYRLAKKTHGSHPRLVWGKREWITVHHFFLKVTKGLSAFMGLLFLNNWGRQRASFHMRGSSALTRALWRIELKSQQRSLKESPRSKMFCSTDHFLSSCPTRRNALLIVFFRNELVYQRRKHSMNSLVWVMFQ